MWALPFANAIVILLMAVLLSGCRPSTPACPPKDERTPSPGGDGSGTQLEITSALSLAPTEVVIGGRAVTVDQVVQGLLCDGEWSGTVYVACDVQVRSWEEQPTFLEGCDLSIAPGTVVYVAYHNDTAYYNGCSCHTGEIGQPQAGIREGGN